MSHLSGRALYVPAMLELTQAIVYVCFETHDGLRYGSGPCPEEVRFAQHFIGSWGVSSETGSFLRLGISGRFGWMSVIWVGIWTPLTGGGLLLLLVWFWACWLRFWVVMALPLGFGGKLRVFRAMFFAWCSACH